MISGKSLNVESYLPFQADPGWVVTDMTSKRGDKTPDEGAETPVFVALLPPGDKTHGKMFSDCKVDDFW